MAKPKLRIAEMLVLEKEVRLSLTNSEHVLTIRPLGLEEVMRLLVVHREQFVSLWTEAQKDEPDYAVFGAGSKQMVAEIIALASGRMDEIDDILRMPGTVQVVALADILQLSVPDPKKLLEAIHAVLATVHRLRKDSPQPQPSVASPMT